jgi:hypothetical protein
MRPVIDQVLHGKEVQDRDGDSKVSYAEFEFGTSRRCQRATLRPTRMRLGAVGCGTLSIVVLVRTAMIKLVLKEYKVAHVMDANMQPDAKPPDANPLTLRSLGNAIQTQPAQVWICGYYYFERGS